MTHKRSICAIALVLALSTVAAGALFAQSASSASDSGSTGISIGAPRSGTRVGVMRSLADGIRTRIRSQSNAGGLIAIIAAAAAYGVFHALGPGHQKTLISGYLLSEGGNALQVLATAGIAAASHATSVVVLFGVLALISGGLSTVSGEGAGFVVTKLSALALAVLALRMLWIRIGRARSRFSHNLDTGHAGRDHSPDCSCALHHKKEEAGKGSPLIIFAGSLVPCPGAAFFLLLGFSAGNPLAGILAVIAISVGMWITLVAVGFMALGLRSMGLSHARRGDTRGGDIMRSILEVGGSALVLVFAVALLSM